MTWWLPLAVGGYLLTGVGIGLWVRRRFPNL
jgi:hypothetical protein